MTMFPGHSSADPRTTLRSYRAHAPWRLRDLAALASALLDRARVQPVSTAASARPTERTIRFYVARGLVNPPEGRGTAATYHYRHLLQVLAIKLGQMDGATLERLAEEFREQPGDVLEHRVAEALGPDLPAPEDLVPVRSGPPPAAPGDTVFPGRGARRITVEPGVEILIDDTHPAWHDPALFRVMSGRVADTLAAIPGGPAAEHDNGGHAPSSEEQS